MGAQCDFVMSDPVVSYRETVTQESSQTCLAKSPNKHNRLYLVAEPMQDDLSKEIEEGPCGPKAELKERVKIMKEKYDWDDGEARKIWAWGPETSGANLVVDKTQGVQYLLEIKEHVASAWQWISKEGPLCEENEREGTPLRQVKAHLPVSESFGFVAALRQQTGGQAFPQCVFDHWENIPGNAMVEGKLQDICLGNRKRKNLKVEMPKLVDYLDKL